jgi:hypothetical protein
MAVRLSAGRALRPRNFYFCFGTHFCQRLNKPQGLVRPERLGKLKKKFIHLIVSRTHDLPACSVVSQPLRYLCPLTWYVLQKISEVETCRDNDKLQTNVNY